MSASCSSDPDSRRSESIGRLSVRCSGPRFSWEIAITGTSSSLASSFICRHPGRSAGYAAGPVARVTEADCAAPLGSIQVMVTSCPGV